ncbi:MAG: iron ABC transporter permease, partial [Hydrogenophaga sp.]|nr:iron ABC transporter permease [Hydrogenophaga sp.]
MNARRASWLVVGLLVTALALAALGVCVGSAGFENLIGPLLNPDADPAATAMAQQIVWEIRL